MSFFLISNALQVAAYIPYNFLGHFFNISEHSTIVYMLFSLNHSRVYRQEIACLKRYSVVRLSKGI